jgi:hypothetical protein
MKPTLKKPHIIAGIIILLIVGSFIAIRQYRLMEEKKLIDQNTEHYNGFVFEKKANMWWTEWQKGNDVYEIPFRFPPSAVENITIEGELEDFYFNRMHITHNPEDSELQYIALAGAELTISLAQVFGVEVISACTAEKAGVCPPRPVITCNNSNESVVLIQYAEEPALKLQGKCIIVEGSGFELVMLVDKMLYDLYGITQ